mmetsp:Transcript_21900/g.37087  ORF Transcript_21900/g.37087 Transcript_21900/m.37087 type:complete len:125 (+) Transcript_21900:227-601(+)
MIFVVFIPPSPGPAGTDKAYEGAPKGDTRALLLLLLLLSLFSCDGPPWERAFDCRVCVSREPKVSCANFRHRLQGICPLEGNKSAFLVLHRTPTASMEQPPPKSSTAHQSCADGTLSVRLYLSH